MGLRVAGATGVMHVGIDAGSWSNRRGFGRYTRELLTHMVRLHPEHRYTLLADPATARAWDFPRGARVEVVPTRVAPSQAASADGSRSLPDLLRMSWAATALSANVFFFPAVYSYFPLFRPVPSVVTFHDAIAEEHPDLVFPERRARLFWRMKTRLALATATRILTVSDSARLQISRLFGIPESAIAVATEGAAEIFGRRHDPLDVARALGKYGLPRDRPLFLYVGGISPHKNIDGLLRALARLQDATFHLAIVGDKDSDTFLSCYPAIAKLAQDLGLASRITFPGFVPDGDLALLYAGATALVFPSFSEGFGLPAVEAMASGLPVAASRAGSLPEVVKDAGLLFDPRDEGSIADAIARLLADAELRARLRRAGLARAAQYSWEPSAHAVVRLLEEIASA